MPDTPETDALDRFRILDSPPNEWLDRLLEDAAAVFGCYRGAITLIDGSRVLLKSKSGARSIEKPKQHSFTSFVIENDGPLIIPDVKADPIMAKHPATLYSPGLRFMAGLALNGPNGNSVGAVIIWDIKPHAPDAHLPDALVKLVDLTMQIEWELFRWELIEAKRQLEKSERLYRALFEPNPDAVYVIDTEGRFTSTNEATSRLTMRSQDELIGQTFVQDITADDRERAWAGFQRCLAGEPQYFQVRLLRKDGSELDVGISLSPYVVGGTLLGVAAISRDISEQVAAEDRLRESEQRLLLALDGSSQVVWDWDVKTGSLLVSAHTQEMLGYGLDELTVTPDQWQQYIHPEDLQRARRELKEGFESEAGHIECEFRFRCKNGSYKWVLDRGKVTCRDASGRPVRVIGTLTDIHARKLAEEERIKQAERMALAVRAGGVGIFELSLDSHFHSWDARMCELLGVPPDEFVPSLQEFVRIVHPEDRNQITQLIARLRRGEEVVDIEFRVVWPDGAIRDLRGLGKMLQLSDSSTRLLIGTCWDVTEERQLQRQLAYQASHDALTGLKNRFEFERRLEAALQSAKQTGKEHALCFIDLDRFKLVNDTAGHAAGDKLLRELGRFLTQQIRSSDVLARLGGDEFGVLLHDCSTSQAESLIEMLLQAVDRFQFQWEERAYDLSISVGIVSVNADAEQVTELMSRADIACYAAKAAGRGRISIYRQGHSDAQLYHREVQLAADVREALSEDRFCLHAQEIRDVFPGGKTHHYELLVRMLAKDGSHLLPATFISAAERYELMSQLDRWVLREVLERQAHRIANIPDLVVSINLSAQSLNDPAFVPFIKELIMASPLQPANITLEITETAAITHLAAASHTIGLLRRLGCAVALDDFGTGLSSFNYLKHFPVDYVKIDGSFICALKHSAVDRTIVEAIHEIAQKLGSRTVAEYVEDKEIFTLVREIGINYAQGFGIGRPRPLSEVLTELASRKNQPAIQALPNRH